MIKSMTGYGQGSISKNGFTIKAEIKSLNHRFLEIFLRLPREFNRHEIDIRNYLKNQISRGKLEVLIIIEKSAMDTQILDIDYSLAQQYYNSLNKLIQMIGLEDKVTLQDIFRCGDIIKAKEDTAKEEETWSLTQNVLALAIQNLQDMRKREGALIGEDIKARLLSTSDNLRAVSERIPERLKEYRSYLQEKIKEIFQSEIPRERIEQEIIVYAEKSDITEEIVRLNIHIQQMIDMLNSENSVGRKMDFLIQEMFREVNTLGSKALDVIISEKVVELKSELEKMREQIQNIE